MLQFLEMLFWRAVIRFLGGWAHRLISHAKQDFVAELVVWCAIALKQADISRETIAQLVDEAYRSDSTDPAAVTQSVRQILPPATGATTPRPGGPGEKSSAPDQGHPSPGDRTNSPGSSGSVSKGTSDSGPGQGA